MENGRIKVMLSTEGTYPFHQGGVSTWCNILVEKLTEIDYTIYSIIMNPFVTQKFILPNSARMIKVPLWGTEEPSEHLTTPFSRVYTAKRYTDNKVIESHFLPLFKHLIEEIISPEKNPLGFGKILIELYKYFQEYDYKNSFKSETVWELFKETVLNYTGDSRNKMAQPSVFDLIQSLGWIYRFLIISILQERCKELAQQLAIVNFNEKSRQEPEQMCESGIDRESKGVHADEYINQSTCCKFNI